jgi:hypothetical protein
MKTTANYGLNQWEAGDRILREDFNSDNAKTDAALLTLSNRLNSKTAFQLLNSSVTGSNASQVNLYTSGSTWAQYHLILAEVVLPSGTAYVGVNGNGRSLTVSSINWDYNGVTQAGNGVPLRMLVPVCQNGAEIFRSLSVGMSFYFGACDIAISSISYLSLKATDSNSTVPAGTTVKVWGVK